MSFSDIVETLLRPLKPELYVGMRYEFRFSFRGSSHTMSGVITQHLDSHRGLRRFWITATGFSECEIRALVLGAKNDWYLELVVGENFTQLIEGKLRLL